MYHGPGVLTNKFLVKGWYHGVRSFANGTWSAAEFSDYFKKVLCFNDKTIKTAIAEVRLCLVSEQWEEGLLEEDLLDGLSLDQREWAKLERNARVAGLSELEIARSTRPLPNPPSMLFLCEINEAIETVMHLNMNVSSSTLDQLFEWTKMNGLSPRIFKLTKPYLAEVAKLRVSEFPTMLIKTKDLGGWVAENYRSMYFLAPWLFNFLDSGSMETEALVLPGEGTNPKYWKKSEMEAWLRVRSVPAEPNMVKNELLALINNVIQDRPSLPVRVDLLEQEKVTGQQMGELFKTVHNYGCSLLGSDLSFGKARNRTLSQARKYLGISFRLDMIVRPHKTPTYISTFSLLGMLRAPEIFELAPLALCYYEGGDMGEGMVKKLRELLPLGLRDSWAINLHETYYRNQALDFFQELLSPLEPQTSEAVARKYRLHKSKLEISSIISSQQVFSFISFRMEDSSVTMGVATKHGGEGYFCPLIVNEDETFRDKYGFRYFRLQLSGTGYPLKVACDDTISILGGVFHSAGVALPSKGKDPYFALLCGDGRKFLGAGRFGATLA